MKRKSIITAACTAIASAALLTGCSHQEYGQTGRVNDDPLVVDQAMQLRDWDKSYANYENGSTKSWSTGFAYASRGDLPYGLNYVADTGSFFGNVLTLPITAYQQRNGVVSSGVNIPETYTAVPPVPPRYATPPGATVRPGGSGQVGPNGQQVPVNAVQNPDAEHGNIVNPTFPANRTNGSGTINNGTNTVGPQNNNGVNNNPGAPNAGVGNSGAAGAQRDTTGGNTGAGGAGGTSTGSGAGGAGGSSGAGGK